MQVTRRQFNKAALAATSAVLTSQIGVAAEQFRLRYVLASSLYGTLPLEVVVGEVRKSGAELIDLWPKVHADHREQAAALGEERLAELLAKHNVRLGMTTRYDLGPFGLSDEFRYLKRMGGRLIISGSDRPKGATTKEQVQAFAARLQPVAKEAEQHGIVVGIENHSGQMLNSLDSIRWFAEAAKSKHLGVALAPSHLAQDSAVLAQLIDDLGPKLVHFYAWQKGDGFLTKLPKEDELKQLPGRGSLDFGPLLAALQRSHYDGWVEIFMHPTPRGVPILESADAVTAAVNDARAYLEQRLTPTR